MTRSRFAVLGAGFWAQYQVAAWHEVPGAQCVAICDVDHAKATKLAKRFAIEQVFDDPAALLASETLDFVDIVTPPHTHRSLVELAAKHKTPAICQKPLAESLDDARQMVETCDAAGVPLYVHENFRWQRPIRELKRILDEGTVGDVFRARINFCSSFPVFENQPNLKELDRFMLTDVGTHILDVARFLFGESKSVYCHLQRIAPDIKGEDVATVILKTHAGATIVNEMSFASRTEIERFPQTYIYIEGSQGSVDLVQDYSVRVTTKSGTLSRRFPPQEYAWANPAYSVAHASIVDCHSNLLAGLRSEAKAETTGEDNLKTLDLVYCAYESADRDVVIQL